MAGVSDDELYRQYETVNLYRRGAGATLELNRPDRLNAWSNQFSLDLLAARPLVLVGGAGGGRFRLRHRRAAALGLPFARQQRIDEYPGNAADRGGGEKGECERLDLHGTLL